MGKLFDLQKAAFVDKDSYVENNVVFYIKKISSTRTSNGEAWQLLTYSDNVEEVKTLTLSQGNAGRDQAMHLVKDEISLKNTPYGPVVMVRTSLSGNKKFYSIVDQENLEDWYKNTGEEHPF